MSAMEKWKWGEEGMCIYSTKAAAESVGKAIKAHEDKQRNK